MIIQQEEKPKSFNKILLYILMLLMIVTGSTNVIFNKCMQKLVGLNIIFEQHHWLITFGMFVGELFSLTIYIYIVIKRKKRESSENNDKVDDEQQNEEDDNGIRPPVPTNLIFSFTALCDLLASTLFTFGLTYLTSSMFQMMKTFQLFFVCLMSKAILKKEIYRHQYLGVGTLILGLFLVGLNSIFEDNEQVAKNPIVGIILTLLGLFFYSIENIIQEKFMNKYQIHPSQLVGFEGLWGTIMYTCLLIAFQYISCDGWNDVIKEGICFKNDKNKAYIEDSIFAFMQMWDNKTLLILYIFFIISVALYNLVGIKLTKLVSSTARVVVDEVRAVFIWLFFMIFNPVKGTEEEFHYLQLIGYIFLVLGTIIYNEILVISFCNLDYYTRDKIKERKYKEIEDNQLYISIGGRKSSQQ